MTDAISAGSAPLQTQSSRPKDDPAKIKQAAGQFEALLIGQMLKSMRESDDGFMGAGADQSSGSAMDYGQEMFAQSLSAHGGLGLSTLVAKGLDKQAQLEAAPAQPGPVHP